MSAPFQKPAKISRQQRWQDRRRAKLGIGGKNPPIFNPLVQKPPQFLQQNFQSQAPQFPPPKQFPPNTFQPPPQQFQQIRASFQAPSQFQPQPFPPSPQSFPLQNQSYDPPQSFHPPSDQLPQWYTEFQQPEIRPQNEFQQQNPQPAARRREPTPPSKSFFTNPVSQAQQKRLELLQQYKKEAQNQISNKQNVYVPEARQRPASRTDVKMINPEQQQIEAKKRQYQADLDKQMKQRQEMKQKRQVTPKQEYFPFGKPGAGAPYRDSSGNIIATRPPKYNQNDPNFLKPANFYAQYGAETVPNHQFQQGRQFQQQRMVQATPSMDYMNQPFYLQDQPVMQSQMINPQMNPQMMNPQMMNPQMMNPQMMNPNMMMSNQMSNPNMMMPNQMSNPQLLNNQMMMAQPISNPQPPLSQFPADPILPQTPPRNFNRQRITVDSHQDLAKLHQAQKRLELGRALQQQIDQRKRKQQQEKRQKILQERLEQERIERQRRQMEQQVRLQAEKKKKQIADLQNFNANNVQVAVPKKPPPKRVRTPIDLPPPQPPRSPPKPFVISPARQEVRVQNFQTRQMPNDMNNQLARLRNQLQQQQNELRQNILQLKDQTNQANQQRFQAQRELQKLREELKLKNQQEEMRQRELYSALVNNNVPPPANKTRMLPPQKLPIDFKRGLDQAELSLDMATKSLTGESKFIPLGKPDPGLIIPNKPESHQPMKKALDLDSYFPSLPEVGPNNLVNESMRSANSSLGLEYINKRNDQRLKALDGIGGGDEIDKLDDLLQKMLQDETPQPKHGVRNSHLGSIREDDEFDMSLPHSNKPNLSFF